MVTQTMNDLHLLDLSILKKTNDIRGTYVDSFFFSCPFGCATNQVIQSTYLHTPEGTERAAMVI